MKRLLTMVLTLLMAASGLALTPAQERAQKATHQIKMATLLESSQCTAVAIGPQALLTTSHCELGTSYICIMPCQDLTRVMLVLRDYQDHSILLLDGVSLTDYVEVDDKALEVGEDIFNWSFPGHWPLTLQKAYVASIFSTDPEFLKIDEVLIDIQAYPGASGSGVFDATTGKLVTLITGVRPQQQGDHAIEFAYGFRIIFSADTLKKVSEFRTGDFKP